MRRFDKGKNMQKVNLMAESRYVKSKGLLNEGSYVDSNGELQSDEPTIKVTKFFPENMHMGLSLVLNAAHKQFLNKIQIGEIPEVREYSSDDIDQYIKLMDDMTLESPAPTGVAAELLKKAFGYYLQKLDQPQKGRPIVSIEEQKEFINDLMTKL